MTKISLERENASHIATLNEEMGVVKEELTRLRIQISTIKTDIAWIKKFFFIIAASSIGALLTGLINILRFVKL